MAVFEPIIQALREWLYMTTKIDRERIIPADDAFVRPALPYLVVVVSHLDAAHGTDESIHGINAADKPTVSGRGFRTGQVTINGYGPSSADLIMQASLQLVHPAMLKHMNAQGFSLRPIGPLVDLSALVSNEIEKRFAKDFELQYLLIDTDPEVMVEMTTLEAALTLERSEDHVDALVDTLTITC